MVKIAMLTVTMTLVAADELALLQASDAIKSNVKKHGDDASICVPAVAGDIAPIAGSFSPVGQKAMMVAAGSEASEAGSFCFSKKDALLIQRTFGSHFALDLDKAVVQKKAAAPAEQPDPAEKPELDKAVGGKNQKPAKPATTPEPAKPTESCQFSTEPAHKYFWDPACKDGGVGCKADGKNDMCRFCGGDHTPACPTESPTGSCQFSTEPAHKYFWDPACKDGGVGCNADGKNDMCRFCGGDHTPQCPSN